MGKAYAFQRSLTKESRRDKQAVVCQNKPFPPKFPYLGGSNILTRKSQIFTPLEVEMQVLQNTLELHTASAKKEAHVLDGSNAVESLLLSGDVVVAVVANG